MKFTPRHIREEVNVSREHPLREFFILTGGVLGGIVVLYFVLGLALDFVIPRIDPGLEEQLGELMMPSTAEGDESNPVEQKLQALLDRVASRGEDDGRAYRIHLIPSKEANAVAMPGGHIIVLSGLVAEAASENELAMVLGHELGHFRHRDHLRGLGRGLVLVVLSSAVFGADSSAAKVMASALGSAEMRFSQRQELQADAYGLELLVATYGHAGGASDFFRRLAEKEEGKELAYFFASHPFPRKRSEVLEETIRGRGYPVDDTVPLDPGYRLSD